ncbi:calcium-binding and coiled-coil domain-containing protein 2 [Brachyhypopomus gauderio]|uniref:calcium-binding and coiled-coil domain-containing protein 2 n=1 Tax=Brachyhypopomus gauderio TaxID=698409 RepID=UPI004041D306
MNDDTLETVFADKESFSQVVFVDVAHSYQINAPVRCCYTLTGGLNPNTRDWIGIFKVGWNSTKQYYNYVWVQPSPEHDGSEPLQKEVVFSEYYLPKDDGEFYQFCYVDSSGQVRGASTPFCFQNPAEASLDGSLENDLLVITTQEQAEQMEKDKENLLAEMDHLKEENKILKNELDDRLHEIHRLRIHMDKLKSSSLNETLPPIEEKPQVDGQITQEQQSLSHTLAENETKQEQESLTFIHEKYKKASQKIIMLKEERAGLMQKLEAQQAEIAQLNPRIEEAMHGYNTLQDHLQLLQVDLQSSRKENERLQAEKLTMKTELEELRGDNMALRTTVSRQGPAEGDKDSKKIQIQALLSQLTEARGTLRKEIQNSNDANQRADRAEREVAELKQQLEQMTAAKDRKENPSHTEAQLKEAQRKIDQLDMVAQVEQLEKKDLAEENKKLRGETERLQKVLFELQVASVAAASPHHKNSLSPAPTTPFNLQLQTQTHSHYYEHISDISVSPTDTENKSRVCRHCHESFPDITEEELEIHEQYHKVCPFCTLICDDMGQREFEDHVYSHEE